MEGFRSTSGGFDTTLDHAGTAPGGSSSSHDAVTYTPQTLTEAQKAQARQNIGAGTGDIAPLSVQTTHAELVALCDTGNLVPGTWYRITDYQFTTTQNDISSKGHRFDILVRADTQGSLCETAYAARHVGDTYFPENTKFEAWELKYCIRNDRSRFGWADEENGKGVVYFMMDEFGNEAHFDFKNAEVEVYFEGTPIARGYVFGRDSDLSLTGNIKRCKIGACRVFSGGMDIAPNIITGQSSGITIGNYSHWCLIDNGTSARIGYNCNSIILISCSSITIEDNCSYDLFRGLHNCTVGTACRNLYINRNAEQVVYNNVVFLPKTSSEDTPEGLVQNANYCQYVGKATDGSIRVWNPADLPDTGSGGGGGGDPIVM